MILIMSAVQQSWKIWQIFSRTWFYIDINYYFPNIAFNIILPIPLSIPALVVGTPVWRAIFCFARVTHNNSLIVVIHLSLFFSPSISKRATTRQQEHLQCSTWFYQVQSSQMVEIAKLKLQRL